MLRRQEDKKKKDAKEINAIKMSKHWERKKCQTEPPQHTFHFPIYLKKNEMRVETFCRLAPNASKKRAAFKRSRVLSSWAGRVEWEKTQLTKRAKTKTNGATMQQSRAEKIFLGIPDLFGHQNMNEKEIDARKEKK